MCHFLFEKILQKALQYKKKEVSLQTEILNLLGLWVEKQLRGVAQLVAHLVWDQGVAGSNPVTPTTERQKRQSCGVVSRP